VRTSSHNRNVSAGSRDLDLRLEHGHAAPVDAEHFEEAVPEALRLCALRALALPLARKD
jgi:hypothetical protein